jgi:5-methylcytosine-specific restriction endonuclease McrA
MNDIIVQTARTVFAYRSREHQRRHGPRGYASYRAYKPWLRDEFTFRCVYCLSRERWCPNGHEEFAVDHLIPRAASGDNALDYDNLVYACQSCNRNRQDAELSIDPGRSPLAPRLSRQPSGPRHQTRAWRQ